MDKETFDRITQISETMKSIEYINTQIKDATLSFVVGNYYDALIPLERKQVRVIQDILSRHEAEIRKEIGDRYNYLKKQVEEL